ncbi:low molecular weight protein-tyrosine-phosphatase [Paraburkholderia nodosa]|uniref:low molecular weight protein-tyrosine-phosphatase n=1 Tax=Paraburkholderia nodosa TaxID=392320 RepID=UPI001B803E12|nr:low molecular weight protein-tyrosine-phosphatase [Paraburkholderia nodosa]
MIDSVLVVCEGNICRSPMAAALLAREIAPVLVRSAGTKALVGHRADPVAVELMAARGVDIRGHRATQLESWLATKSDLILAMDAEQKRFIERRIPSLHGRVFRLGDVMQDESATLDGFDVPDPYRRGRDAFMESLKHIDEGVSMWARRVEAMRGR